MCSDDAAALAILTQKLAEAEATAREAEPLRVRLTEAESAAEKARLAAAGEIATLKAKLSEAEAALPRASGARAGPGGVGERVGRGVKARFAEAEDALRIRVMHDQADPALPAPVAPGAPASARKKVPAGTSVYAARPRVKAARDAAGAKATAKRPSRARVGKADR